MPLPLEQAPAHPQCPPKVWTSTWILHSRPFKLDRSQVHYAITPVGLHAPAVRTKSANNTSETLNNKQKRAGPAHCHHQYLIPFWTPEIPFPTGDSCSVFGDHCLPASDDHFVLCIFFWHTDSSLSCFALLYGPAASKQASKRG